MEGRISDIRLPFAYDQCDSRVIHKDAKGRTIFPRM